MDKPGKTPLLNALIKHKRSNVTSFHMPGHKQGKGIDPRFATQMRDNPFSFDMTEIPGLDDLHNPNSAIKEAQISAARVFGASRTFFLINGTTVGIQAAILSVCKQGEEILLPRDIHRSVIGACILSGAKPRYLPVRLNCDFLVPLPPTADEVNLAIAQNPSVKAVFQVYPSYYGLAGDLAKVAQVAHRYNLPLIVDEAHAAHFAFSDRLPETALKLGADISIQSTHKTLGALTQASMLHVAGNGVDCNEISRQLSVLQTTSPSYLLMASLDAANWQMHVSGQALIEKTINLSVQVRDKLGKIPGLRCMGSEILGQGIHAIDPTKLLLSVKDTGLTGYQVAESLRRKYKIQVELCDKYNILCMFSLGNNATDARKLVTALGDIVVTNRKPSPRGPYTELKLLPDPQIVLTPREAWFAPHKRVLLEKSIGQIAAEMLAPYPPGIPLFCPGEIITYEIVELVKQLKREACSFHGPTDQTLETVGIVDR